MKKRLSSCNFTIFVLAFCVILTQLKLSVGLKMIDFLHFLLKTTSLITILVPCILCACFIGYELKTHQTNSHYYILFMITLFLGVFANRWSVEIIDNNDSILCHIGLHIWPLFLLFVSITPFFNIKWNISTPMFMALSYLQVLFVDCVMVYTTNMPHLIMQNSHLNEKDAHALIQLIGSCYSGIGGAGWNDILFLAFVSPLIAITFDKVLKLFQKEALSSN